MRLRHRSLGALGALAIATAIVACADSAGPKASGTDAAQLVGTNGRNDSTKPKGDSGQKPDTTRPKPDTGQKPDSGRPKPDTGRCRSIAATAVDRRRRQRPTAGRQRPAASRQRPAARR